MNSFIRDLENGTNANVFIFINDKYLSGFEIRDYDYNIDYEKSSVLIYELESENEITLNLNDYTGELVEDYYTLKNENVTISISLK